MKTFTLHIPKTCTSCRVTEADGEFVVSMEFQEDGDPAPAPAVSVEASKRSSNAARQRRYRERKRNADRNAGVTNVTETVTRNVTRNAPGYIVCSFDSTIQDINQEKKSIKEHSIKQKSVARNVTPTVTRNASEPSGQLRFPMKVPIENWPRLDVPEIHQAFESFEKQRRRSGYFNLDYEHQCGFFEFLDETVQLSGVPAAVQVLEYAARERRWSVLVEPPRKENPYAPEYYTGGKEDEEEEIRRKLALGGANRWP